MISNSEHLSADRWPRCSHLFTSIHTSRLLQ